MSAADRSGFRPPTPLPPSRTDGAGPQPSNLSTPPTAWPSSGPGLTGAGTPGQAQTKARASTGGPPDGKSISSHQVSVGTPSAPAVAELHLALMALVGLVPQDGKHAGQKQGKPASEKHQKQLEEKLQAFAKLAATSRDAALDILVKSFEMLARREDPTDPGSSLQSTSLFCAVAERVFLALDVGGDIANLHAALAAIPGGDVLAASPAKAALPRQMMRALALAVGAPTPERPYSRTTVPQGHIDALFARVTAGPASEKTPGWLGGITQGLLEGAVGMADNFPPRSSGWHLNWAGQTLATLSGEQLAGMAGGVLRGLHLTLLNSCEQLMFGLTAPQKGAVGVGAGQYLRLRGTAASVIVEELAPLIEELLPLNRTAFVCGMATQVPPEHRDALVKDYVRGALDTYSNRRTQRTPELQAAFRLAVALASDPFAEFAHALGAEGRLERLETVLQIPGMARAEHARRLAELVDGGVMPRARAEALALALQIGPAFSSELLRVRLESAGQALRQAIADAVATLGGVKAEDESTPESMASLVASFEALDAACDTYAQDAGFAAYMGQGDDAEAAAPPGLQPEAVTEHLAALARLLRHVQPPQSKGAADLIHQKVREQVAAKLTSFVDAFRDMPAGAGLPWPVVLEPEPPQPPSTRTAPAVRESKDAGDTKAGPPKTASQEVQPSRSTSTAAAGPLDEDDD